MIEVTNLTDLRNYHPDPQAPNQGLTNGLLVQVKGHNLAGDGGGGLFMWRTDVPFRNGQYSVENKGTIVKSNFPVNLTAGSWVRQFDGFINVTFFGAFGIPGNDYTEQIQRAINFAEVNSGEYSEIRSSTVYIPNGSYLLSTIELRSGVNIVGESISKTQIFTKNDQVNEYLFTIGIGQVFINISNLNIRLDTGIGANEIPKGGFFFEAKLSTHQIAPVPNDGGLWFSTFKNIRIDGLYGNGIYLKGGEGPFSFTPNQFNVFENVRIFKNNDANFTYFYNALKMTGENGQHTFINCQFDSVKKNAGKVIIKNIEYDQFFFDKWINVMIESQPEGSDFSYATSHVVTFLNCTIQNSFYGIKIDYAENITIDNCWFEDLGVAIMVKGNPIEDSPTRGISKSINVLNNRFSNAAGFGSTVVAPRENSEVKEIKKGQCVSVENSVVNIYNNYVTASDPSRVDPESGFVVGFKNNNGINLMSNTFRDDNDSLSRTYGVMQFVDIEADNSIKCKSNKLLFVRVSEPYSVNKIISTINSGETITFRAFGYEGGVLFTNYDNIFLANKKELLLKHGEIATFIKVDFGQEYVEAPYQYQLLSYVNNTP